MLRRGFRYREGRWTGRSQEEENRGVEAEERGSAHVERRTEAGGRFEGEGKAGGCECQKEDDTRGGCW